MLPVHCIPEGLKRIEEFLSPFFFVDFLQHSQGRDAGYALALELEVVAQLGEARLKGALEGCHGKFLSPRVLAMLRRSILVVELLRKIFVEVTVHHIDSAGIERRTSGGSDPAQLLYQLLALFNVDALPRRAVLSLVAGEQTRIDRGHDAIRIGEVGVESFRLGDRGRTRVG